MYLNKALVYGNLTRDPEMRALPSGISVATFSIATNRVWNDKSGVKQESVDYHNIVVFGRQAEIVNQYLKKGSSALIEGRMQTRSWEADGVKKYRTEIVAERVQFGPRAAGGGSSYNSGNKDAGAKEATKEDKEEVPVIEYPDDDGINPDDIPF